jgi:hypothetical protein
MAQQTSFQYASVLAFPTQVAPTSVPAGQVYVYYDGTKFHAIDSTLSDVIIAGSGGAVTSVFGRTGAVAATSGDYSVAQVTGAAPLASPTFTGTVSAAAITASGLITASAKLGVNATPTATQDVSITSLANGNDIVRIMRNTDTAPTGNAIRVQKADGVTDLFVVDKNGILTKIAGFTTAGNGIAIIDGLPAPATFSAAAGVTNLLAAASNPSGGGRFLITYHVQLTVPATTSSTLGGTNGFQVSYTSLDGSVAIANIKPTYTMQAASLSANTTSTFFSGDITVAAAGGTAITYICDYTSAGATPMSYVVRTSCQFIG